MRETPKAQAALHEYLLLGPGRSLAKLAEHPEKFGMSSVSVRHLEKWSASHHWQERATAHDRQIAEEADTLVAEERAKILKSDFALMHRRVQALDALAKKLLADVTKGKMYLKDVKAVGTGPNAKQIDLETFNEGLIREIRGCFADIAAELGERVKKQELSVKELPKLYVDLSPDEDGIDP